MAVYCHARRCKSIAVQQVWFLQMKPRAANSVCWVRISHPKIGKLACQAQGAEIFALANTPIPLPEKRPCHSWLGLFSMMFAFGKWCWLRQWWRLRLMMCACGHIRANIASLRHEVAQHHFERSEKHHIAAGDASLFFPPAPISRKVLQSPRFYDILITERRWGY